ncbi:hypothetical protein EDD18DRAFT_1410329 [Armillaria luteobubalina]|uniref:Uncharacterized protein n=1 Tax=Armillaria luteobubalina TaxID=153913 RepID=A0AA39PXP9_9AGAR|nr:hypothetical protein EDD18DRAFT_1410329 [Armillaria luteobubalina]
MSEFIESQLPLPRLALPSFPTHSQSDNPSIYPDPLEPLVLPVDSTDITGIQKERKDCIIQILRLGRNERLGNGLRTASALTHNQYMKIFPEETRILDGLLTSISVCTTFSKDVVYKLDEKIYQELLTRLTNLHALASSSLQSFGYSALRPPVWAIDTSKGLTANDFEVYALQYHICVENFLYMLDEVHDWDRCLTKIYLDEELLAMQHNTDRSHLKNREYYLPAVPPIPHIYPSKSKTSFQTSVFNSNWGRVHHDIPTDKEQHPSNSQAINIRGQSCLCANSKVDESHNLPSPGQCERMPVVSHQAQIPNDLDCRNHSLHPSVYQGCPFSNGNSGQGNINGNKYPFHCDPGYPQISPWSDYLEHPSIHLDTAFKTTKLPTCNRDSNTMAICENELNNIPALHHSISNTILDHSSKGEIRTFRIASNTPCASFSGEDKGSLLPRKVRRRICQLWKRLQKVLRHLTFNFLNRRHRLTQLRECMQWPSLVISLRNEVSRHFTMEKSALTPLPSVHLQTAVRGPGSYTTMTTMGTEPRYLSWKFCESVSTPTTESTRCYYNIECTMYKPEESDARHRIHARQMLHEYDNHSRGSRDVNQTHLPTKPQSTISPSNGSRDKYITSPMSPRVVPNYPSESYFELSKEEGDWRTVDDRIQDLDINICDMAEVNDVQGKEMRYSGIHGRDVQPVIFLRQIPKSIPLAIIAR